MKPQPRPIEILLVEDNPADVDLTLESFSDIETANRLHPVKDGEEALRFLRREGEYAGAVRPDMVLLDLNLPRLDGLELLEIIKNDQVLKTLPVLVLTSSHSQKDILASYSRHANCYLTKPLGLDQFYQIARTIEAFWFQLVALPRHERPS